MAKYRFKITEHDDFIGLYVNEWIRLSDSSAVSWPNAKSPFFSSRGSSKTYSYKALPERISFSDDLFMEFILKAIVKMDYAPGDAADFIVRFTDTEIDPESADLVCELTGYSLFDILGE